MVLIFLQKLKSQHFSLHSLQFYLLIHTSLQYFPANLFIPFLYTLKLIHPPITSPNKEIKNPFIGPKNTTILAPVTNTEGTIPSNAIITLINKLINIANSLY